jgi:hypothetical protein
MRVHWQRWIRFGLAGVLALALLGPPAVAQDDEDQRFREPGINYMAFREPYIEWIFGAAIIVACLAVAFKNPHRSHLD